MRSRPVIVAAYQMPGAILYHVGLTGHCRLDYQWDSETPTIDQITTGSPGWSGLKNNLPRILRRN